MELPKIEREDYKIIFWGLIFGLIVGYCFYQKGLNESLNVRSTPSQFGGYMADGNFSYCEGLIDVRKQYCKEEKDQALILTNPDLARFAYFVIFPFLPLGCWYFMKDK
jgi:hypothetical protein